MFIIMCFGIILVIAVVISATVGNKLYDGAIKFFGIYKDENKKEQNYSNVEKEKKE